MYGDSETQLERVQYSHDDCVAFRKVGESQDVPTDFVKTGQVMQHGEMYNIYRLLKEQ